MRARLSTTGSYNRSKRCEVRAAMRRGSSCSGSFGPIGRIEHDAILKNAVIED